MIQDFFEQILHYDRSPLTDNLLGLIGKENRYSLMNIRNILPFRNQA